MKYEIMAILIKIKHYLYVAPGIVGGRSLVIRFNSRQGMSGKSLKDI